MVIGDKKLFPFYWVLAVAVGGAGSGPATTVIMHSDITFGRVRNAFGAVMRLTYRSHCAAALQKFLFIFYMGLLCGNQSLYKQAGVK